MIEIQNHRRFLKKFKSEDRQTNTLTHEMSNVEVKTKPLLHSVNKQIFNYKL